MKIYKCLNGNLIFYSMTAMYGRILYVIDVDKELLNDEDLEASVLAQERKDDLEAIGIYL